MSSTFTSRWLGFDPETATYRSDKSDKSDSVSFVTFGTCFGGRSEDTRSERLRAAGDAAEAVNLHCEACDRCRPEGFTGDVLQYPLCPEGLELRRRYREARRLALAGMTR
ncbi:MAG TPA: hypothetical protein P5234_10115 [Thermoanaerobaculaceae bacterium]|nr:hypothetical protein [Thermoanaerobaculaceae bacterium]HRS16582.1 hypothetical protein [Thermoanaerobaculaceae bacterium]